ncbi:hypothetical protein [Rhodopirellula sp. P2]|uniref:hypothetical protein n=1 Tax=Rhodopirellula sp. P2 TaxID=2127060 RepID=UPI002367BC2B|nr:hypothetical protein [Rhodopirellula sp. P2]WDQ18081.1 hypothetical protein PSR62_05885 [Rhodopirellula sp. P2]
MSPHFIRIIVTLCLIVAATIQPMSLLAIAAPCGDDVCVVPLKCEGCGCCDVEHQSDKCCCCSDDESKAERPKSDSDEFKPGESALAGHCTCGVSNQPMNRGESRESLVRELSLRIASLDFVELPTETIAVLRPSVVDATPGSRADFGQRFLCVWRI